MGFPRQELWNGFPFPPPGDLPEPEIEPAFPAAPTLVRGFLTTEPAGKPWVTIYMGAFLFSSVYKILCSKKKLGQSTADCSYRQPSQGPGGVIKPLAGAAI